jgi:membrane protein
MSEEIENKLNTIPVIKQLVALGKTIKPTSLEGLSVYDILELYVIGIFKGAFSYRASAVAFSFFMALFPFALFIFNLIPNIPLKYFKKDFFNFVAECVTTKTF